MFAHISSLVYTDIVDTERVVDICIPRGLSMQSCKVGEIEIESTRYDQAAPGISVDNQSKFRSQLLISRLTAPSKP